MSPIEIRRTGRAVEIALNRPDRGNAFGDPVIQALEAALDRMAGEDCDTVIFRGAGKGFCGGLDLSELDSETDATLMARLIRIELLLQRIARLPQRTVALAHRFAFGAGADLVLACRQRIAAPGTRFSFPGVRFGIALGTGRLIRSVGADRAQALLMRTTPIDAQEALACGLIGELMPEEAWDAFVGKLGAEETALDARMSRIVAARMDPGLDDADLAALVRSAALPGLRDRIADHAAKARAAAKRRDEAG